MPTIQIGNEEFKTDYAARQATSSLWYKHQGTIILAAVVVDKTPVTTDFLPLSVQYSQRSYAIGRFPGGFSKREGKMSEFETLTSRIIDRSLRPLFPKNYAYPTQITLLVLSHDQQSDLQVCALNAASNALYLANMGINAPLCALRVGKIDNNYVFNPSVSAMKESTLDLYVCGSVEALLMIEMQACGQHFHPLPEDQLLEVLSCAHQRIQETCQKYTHSFEPLRNPPSLPLEFKPKEDKALQALIHEHFHPQVLEITAQMAKSERHAELAMLTYEIALDLEQKGHGYVFEEIQSALSSYVAQVIRGQILEQHKRPDGRDLDTIRPISIETNILPHCHGSALFTRGHTQALVTCTLGLESDAKIREHLDDKALTKEKFMFHYNFPPFSVGEATPLGAPSRRELGHGNLAKRALESSIIDKNQVIRLVSEILESNGSSSMASVCGGSLALCASGVGVHALVAGVAMGLILEGDKHVILSDISALEDMHGDMDFKIAGSLEGIMAMQMDTKLQGIRLDWLQEILEHAKKARSAILDRMQEARERLVLNTQILPTLQSFNITPKKIALVIGPSGKTIKEIIERFQVQIDLDKASGQIQIKGTHAEGILGAKHFILDLVQQESPQSPPYHVGEIVEVEIKKIVDFGAFVRLPRGGESLLHKSCWEQRGLSADFLHEGGRVTCKIVKIHAQSHKIDLDLA
ncbi:polyribonucleotide nucleotidyltransferase [Helicobacter bizzozeronii]|uniref:polyribonucleotide nucleotidyltransferase n=1 Tax=Helicobacter bizzozeronii TaxID=56877 RepID=UPI000CED99BE|nr:polyribonucleotide nucleotidyltransferase [Helicobacter bizzozeronii]